jgi:exodeoxyribonuclease V alpha subunit
VDAPPQHGAQFKIAAFKSELPASVYGIRKYLGSGLVPGIGRVYANKIVDAFGTDTFRVLSEESGKLRDVPGIGASARGDQAGLGRQAHRARALHLPADLRRQPQPVREAREAVRRAGEGVLTNEPYRVAREIEGIGFKTADKIAINLGFANDAAPRLEAGILYALEVLQEEGHTAFPEEALRDHASEMLDTSAALVTARIEAPGRRRRQLIRHFPGRRGSPARLGPRPAARERPLRAQDRRGGARLQRVASGLPPIKVEAALGGPRPRRASSSTSCSSTRSATPSATSSRS